MEQLVPISNKFNSLTVNVKEFIYKFMQALYVDDSQAVSMTLKMLIVFIKEPNQFDVA